MAAPTFVAAQSSNTLAANSLTVARPAGLQGGDVLVLFVGIRDGSGRTVSVAGGSGTWVQRQTVNNGVTSQGVLLTMVVEFADLEPANYTISIDGAACRMAAGIAAYRGCDRTAPHNASSSASGTSTAPAPGDIATTVADCKLVWMVTGNFSTSSTVTHPTSPGTFTERWNNSSNIRDTGSDLDQAATGTVTSPAGTLTASETWDCAIIALAPGPPPAPVVAAGTATWSFPRPPLRTS